MTKPSLAAACLVASILVGCGGSQPQGPEVASSKSHQSYVVEYASELGSSSADVNDRQATARKSFDGFAAFPNQLKDNHKRAIEIMDLADKDGRSSSYVDRMHQADQVHAFYEREKEDIVRHVGGSCNAAAKAKGCDADISGAVSYALKDSIDKQLQKELREESEAQLMIDRYRGQLGKATAETLEKQADTVSFTSYIVHIEMIETREKLKKLVDEADSVKSAADAAIEDEKKLQQEKGFTAADKKASDERIAEITKAKATIDGNVTKAKAALPQLDQQIDKLKSDYEAALSGLKSKLEEKAKASPSK